MVGIEVNRNYKYKGVVLASGAKVTANMVTIENNGVARVENGNVLVEGAAFNFSIYNEGIDGKKTYNLSNVPENVDGQAIVKEFVSFVERDIA